MTAADTPDPRPVSPPSETEEGGVNAERERLVALLAEAVHATCDWEHYMGHEPSERDEMLAAGMAGWCATCGKWSQLRNWPNHLSAYPNHRAAIRPLDTAHTAPQADAGRLPIHDCGKDDCMPVEHWQRIAMSAFATPAGLDTLVANFIGLHDEEDGAGWPCDGRCASVRALRAASQPSEDGPAE